MSSSCDTVYMVSQILPNVVRGMNGEEYTGLKIERGSYIELKDKELPEGLLLIFSAKSNKLVDILYKNNIRKYLTNLGEIIDEDTKFMVIHSIEDVEHQNIAFEMIKNYLNLILDNCE